MGKYEPLTRHLEALPGDVWDARFDDVAKVLGFPLPTSAHNYPAWWANQEPGHSQTAGWRDAGWETSRIDLRAKRLRFVRSSRPRDKSEANVPLSLIEQAKLLTGIENQDKLIDEAIKALIERESANYVVSLGGSQPEAKAPPRRRFPWKS